MRGVADGNVIAKPAPLSEENVRIVFAEAYERKFEGAGIGHVRADIEKILKEPKPAERDARGFALDEEETATGEGRYEFGECAAKDSHGVTERTEERMAGFVNEEIGEVNKKKTRSVERGV